MLPTVEDVLALPEVRAGSPRVVAGARGLGRPVRWLHVSEVTDIGKLLVGRELILMTGVALPEDPTDLGAYVHELDDAGASGLVVELGRRYDELPVSLVVAADRRGLPLVALRREVRFVSITEAVHAMIVDEQVQRLTFADRVHHEFVQLSTEGATASEVVTRAAALAGAPVVLESPHHRVLAAATDGHDGVLGDWEARSRRVWADGRIAVAGPEGWLVTAVGARGEVWGRLVVIAGDDPTPQQAMVAEWAATALAINRLVERDQLTVELQAQGTLLADLARRAPSPPAELRARLRAAGLPVERRRFLGLAIRPLGSGGPEGPGGAPEPAPSRLLAESVARAAEVCRLPALVGNLGPDVVAALVSITQRADHRAVTERLAGEIHDEVGRAALGEVVIGAASPTLDVTQLGITLVEADQVADAARALGERRALHERSHIRFRGLLHHLADDSRLQQFVEQELGALLAHDTERGTDLLGTLEAYLAAGRNTSAAAATYHLSRAAFHRRLRAIEAVIDGDLGSVEVCLSLHVALEARQVLRARHR
ncbi:MAG: PucR family transcriptional regulator ligand-binding domain-containing protein [Actinomycetota bacterium]|nr:PucR family transcriptional regulator ligand-binding domain-containing protein [Actinomycetota bacterium]